MSKARDSIEDLRSIATVDDAQTFTADQSHGDGVKAKFGTGDDLQIYHDGSNSYIDDVGYSNWKSAYKRNKSLLGRCRW